MTDMFKYSIGDKVKFKTCFPKSTCKNCNSCIANCFELVDSLDYVHGTISSRFIESETVLYQIRVREDLPIAEKNQETSTIFALITENFIEPSKLLKMKSDMINIATI